MGVLGHSTGGGAAVLAASKDKAIKAIVTVSAAETKPSAVHAAGLVEAPSLHLIGGDDTFAMSDGERIAKSWTGPSQLRVVKGSGHLGLAEGKNWTNTLTGTDGDKGMQRVTRMLASAFFIRYLTDAPQLADELEDKVRGSILEDLTEDEEEASPADGQLTAG
jgi:dienelactone hydrolase